MTLADQLAMLSHSDLYRLRNKQGANQGMLGPLEHRAFAREFAQDNPLTAAISLPFAIPAYSGYKALGFGNARSPASMDEILQGYKGLLEGLIR